MAFNPSPKVAAARDIATKFKKDKVIVFMIDDAAKTIEYASYGKNPSDCKEARRIANHLFESFAQI